MAKRNIYLSTTPVDEAADIYLNALKKIVNSNTEYISSENSLGRITSSAIYAKCCSPLFNAAAMDGIAVISARTRGASETQPLQLKRGEDFIIVDTGDSIHPPFDAVIMAEDTWEVEQNENLVEIRAAASAWQHIRPIGEDIVSGEMLLPAYHKIRPIDIGVLISGGILEIQVFQKPKVGLIPTGTEIIEPVEEPRDGDIIESNSRMFAAMVLENGGVPHRYNIQNDDYERIKDAVKMALVENDLVIVNAGSSAGTEDYTVHVLRELGQVLVHGVAIKPGKPVILAIVQGKPVIGLPGYPVSAYIAFENFVKPVMALYTGAKPDHNDQVQAVISKRLVSSLKHKEYVRVKVGSVDGKLVASPLARGAGAAMSLVRADGFCVIEQNSEGFEAGETVKVQLYRGLSEILDTVVCIGSHDLILDIIADIMPITYPGMNLSSTHVGSMGGLMALKRNETHLASTHLLDENGGEYNIPYLKRLFPEERMVLVKGVGRTQGIIVKKGNPLNIRSIEDFTGCNYVNRQRGAGTRVLLDYKLKLAGIDTASISGYEREAATHMAVAAAIKSGGADAGMGILSAAKAMDLDFIPVGEEEYDFAMKASSLDLDRVQAFLDVLRSKAFQTRVLEIGGYNCSKTGEVLLIGE